MMSYADQQRIAVTLGMRVQPGLATGYPALVGKLDRIYADRVAKLPWVPRTWLAAVRDVQAKNPADLIRPTPGFNALGARGNEAPSWADTPAKLTAWHTIYTAHNDAIVAYAKEMQEDGESELNALYADAAFWDGAYKLAVFTRDLPSNVVSTVGGGISSFVGTFLPESLKAYAKWVTWGLVLLIVGGLILWYRRKLGAIVKGFKKGAA